MGGSLYMRTLASIAGIVIFLFSPASSGAQDTGNPFPRVGASYLMELNGEHLWAKRPATKLAPASLTKIMTALLVVERDRLDEIVTLSPAASRETGTRLGLRKGEKERSIPC
jgi:serine-type D-Ala-D-Ala carboxypeptidase (penicillin-binding protein 5/6)